MSETILELEYLFSWDEIPGKDSDRLREFLLRSDIEWVKKAKIEKVDNGNTISIFDKKNSLFLKLNSEITKANLESDDICLEFIIKAEEGKLNVYYDEGDFSGEEAEEKPRSFKTENDLIQFIKESSRSRRFWQELLKDKIEREQKAMDLLNMHTEKIDENLLNQIFDVVDLSETYAGRWWGQLLSKPNRNNIFTNPTDKLKIWINYLLNGKEPESVRIEKCLENPNYKLNGAGKGLVTLFLYLKDPASFNVMMDTTIDGLEKLGRFNSKKGKRKWGEYYNNYNAAVKDFRDQFDLEPQSIDWVLTNISSHKVQRNEDGSFIGHRYDNEDENAVNDLENDFVHPTKELIKKALDELGKTKVSKEELIPKLKEIAGRDGGVLISEKKAWNEIQKLSEEKNT